MSGDQLGLIEAALASTGVAGRSPSDDIDVDAGAHPDLLEAPPHETGEMTGHRPPIVELETEDHSPSPTGERNRHEHTWALRRTRQQSEPTGATDRSAGGIATGATNREHPRQQPTEADQPTRTLGALDSSRGRWGRERGRDRGAIEHAFSLRKGCDTLPDRAAESTPAGDRQ